MKRVSLLLLIVLGFFLLPSEGYSCEMNSKKSCCNKEVASSKKERMDCCKNNNSSKSKNHEHDGACNGKCGHTNCTTTSSSQFNIAFFEIKFNNNSFHFSEKENNYFISGANLSSGFISLWLIPKIS